MCNMTDVTIKGLSHAKIDTAVNWCVDHRRVFSKDYAAGLITVSLPVDGVDEYHNLLARIRSVK